MGILTPMTHTVMNSFKHKIYVAFFYEYLKYHNDYESNQYEIKNNQFYPTKYTKKLNF